MKSDSDYFADLKLSIKCILSILRALWGWFEFMSCFKVLQKKKN